MRRFTQVPLCALVLGINARHNYGSEKELRELGDSYLKNPIHPLIIRACDKLLIDGSCRAIGMRLILGEDSDRPVECIEVDEDLSPMEILVINMTTALHRKDLSGFDKWQCCESMLKSNSKWTQKDIAVTLGIDAGSVTRFMSPGKCLLAVQEALKSGQITLADTYAISKADSKVQHELLHAKLHGASAAEITRAARLSKNGHVAVEKKKSLKCPLPDGSIVGVTLAHEGGIAEAIQVVKEWLKAAQKAMDEGLEPKTFEKAMRDRAKKHDE